MTTHEEAVRLVNNHTSGYTPEQQRRLVILVENGHSLFHAGALEHQRVLNVAPRCSLCGSRYSHGDHNLCKVRADRGRPTPPLGDERAYCGCYDCSQVGDGTLVSL